MLVNNPMICGGTMDLGCTHNTFDVLGGIVDDFVSLGYLSGYDALFDSYCIYLVDKPIKIM